MAATIDHVIARPALVSDFRDHAVRLMKRHGRHGLRRRCEGQGKGSNCYQSDHCFLHDEGKGRRTEYPLNAPPSVWLHHVCGIEKGMGNEHEIGKLHIVVASGGIVVTMPGTDFLVVYTKPENTECDQELIEIDNRGERLWGCLTCNLWAAEGNIG